MLLLWLLLGPEADSTGVASREVPVVRLSPTESFRLVSAWIALELALLADCCDVPRGRAQVLNDRQLHALTCPLSLSVYYQALASILVF